MMLADPRIARLITLIRACLHPPQGAGRIALALALGVICHMVFAAGVLRISCTAKARPFVGKTVHWTVF
jgi:hypothetical protein